jgi:glutaredoxin
LSLCVRVSRSVHLPKRSSSSTIVPCESDPAFGPASSVEHRRARLSDKIVIYTHPDCGYSNSLKADLDSGGVEYEEINLALHPEQWAKVEELTGGDRTTPVTVEGGLVTVGYGGVG